MAKKTQTIRIESILGGVSDYLWGGGDDQFMYGYGIDPYEPVNDTATNLAEESSALNISATSTRRLLGIGSLADAVCWMVSEPISSSNNLFVYDVDGSVYTIENTGTNTQLTGIGDLTDGGSSDGDGCAYYDNYMYFSRSTTVARYGPLNGTPTFTDDFWVATLGKTALADNGTLYGNMGPAGSYMGLYAAHHFLHAHSDGRLYIIDLVDGAGTIHYIKTSQTTTPGDTDAGSTYNALNLPFGYVPVGMASFGEYLAIAVNVYGGTTSPSQEIPGQNARVVFWDGVSDSPNFVVFNGITDTEITAIVNVAGELYVFTHNSVDTSVRILKYLGGDFFQQVKFVNSRAPLPGGVVADLNRLLFAGGTKVFTTHPSYSEMPGVYSLEPSGDGFSLQMIAGSTNSNTSTNVCTALARGKHTPLSSRNSVFFATRSGAGNYIEENRSVVDPHNVRSEWMSKYYRINKRFKVTKIAFGIPNLDSDTITPYIYTDFIKNEYTGATYALPPLSVFDGRSRVVLRPNGVEGFHGFCLRFVFDTTSGNAGESVALPIDIELEIYDDTN